MGFVLLISPNRRSPALSTTGKIFSLSSSTRPPLYQRGQELEAGQDEDLAI